MSLTRLAAPVLSLMLGLGLAAGAVHAGPAAGTAHALHLVPMTSNPIRFIRLPGDPDRQAISLDSAAIAALAEDADIYEIQINYDGDGATSAWNAERDFDPRLETILASTGARAQLVATSFGKYKRSYWFATGEDDGALVRAFRSQPQPPGAAIAVLRSNRETLASLQPSAAELAARTARH